MAAAVRRALADDEPDEADVRAMAQALGEMGHEPDLFRAPVPFEERPQKRLLVVGCPRSGTKSFSRVLMFFGLRVEHEQMGEDGLVDSTFTVPRTTRDPANFTPDGLWQYRFDRTIQLVRNPLWVIASLCRELYPSWWTWQEIHTGIAIAGERPTPAEAARYWCWWTDQADKLSGGEFVRIEDFGQFALVANLGKRGKAGPVRSEDLGVEMAAAVAARALRYGYVGGKLL